MRVVIVGPAGIHAGMEQNSRRWRRFFASSLPPLLAVALCLSVTLMLLAAMGYGAKPGQGRAAAMGNMAGIVWNKAMSHGNNYRVWFKSLLAATPLLLTGLAAAVAFRAGVLNIGGEGQFLVGAIAATAVGIFWHQSAWIVLPALILASMAAGAVLAAIASLLDRWRNVPVVLSTLLLNFVAMRLVKIVLVGPLQGHGGQPASDVLPMAACLPQWIPQGGALGLHLGCALALAAAIAVGAILRWTGFGFRLRMVGENPVAARFAGVRVGRVAFASLSLSGALAGLAGGIQISGIVPNQFVLSMRDSGLGFAGIAVALLGRLRVGGVIAAALFFGILHTAFDALANEAGVPFVANQAAQGGILIAMLILTHPLGLARLRRRFRWRS